MRNILDPTERHQGRTQKGYRGKSPRRLHKGYRFQKEDVDPSGGGDQAPQFKAFCSTVIPFKKEPDSLTRRTRCPRSSAMPDHPRYLFRHSRSSCCTTSIHRQDAIIPFTNSSSSSVRIFGMNSAMASWISASCFSGSRFLVNMRERTFISTRPPTAPRSVWSSRMKHRSKAGSLRETL